MVQGEHDSLAKTNLPFVIRLERYLKFIPLGQEEKAKIFTVIVDVTNTV